MNIEEIEERHEANKRISGTYNTSIYGREIEFLLSEVKRWKDAYNSEFLLRMDLVSDKEDLKDEVKRLRELLEPAP